MNANERQYLNYASARALAGLQTSTALTGLSGQSFGLSSHSDKLLSCHSRSLASIRGCTARHPDGRWVEKSECPFNWDEGAAWGELVSRMWVSDQKLANGVEIPAELWSLIGQKPDATMMIVVDDDHAPCALIGQELLELKDSRQITLHPTRYRIVENHASPSI
jgi:hypothetical protein